VVARSAQSNVHERRRGSSTGERRRKPRLADRVPQVAGPSDTTPSGARTFAADIQTIGAAIAWLSGAVAGLGAIFYAFGYLASVSYVRMLGLQLSNLHYDHTFYVQRGAGFFLLLVWETAPYLFLVSVLALLILFTFLGLRWVCQRLEISAPFRRLSGNQIRWLGIAYVTLLLLLGLQVSTHLWDPESIATSGVLQSSPDQESATGAVRALIVSGKEDLLHNQFAYLATQQVWIGALLLLAWSVCRACRWRVLLMAPFAMVFVTSTFYLALQYGVLALPVTFREAAIPAEDPSAKVYLLNQVESGSVFWDPRHRQARWMPIETQVDFSQSRTIKEILGSSGRAIR